jgi:acetate kinase
MGELDTLVFTGGIGKHDPDVRAKICRGMEIFGLQLDENANKKGATEIASHDSAISVQVIETDEDAQIARHVTALLQKSNATHQ